MTNLDSILKSRDITLPAKVRIVKAMVFPVVMDRCESWTIMKAKCQGIDAFELWCWRRLLRVSWTARRSNQSILKEISPEYSLEELMLKLKLQYFGELTHCKRPWCWERLRAGGKGDNKGWDDWMASPTRWTWVWTSSGSWWWTGKPGMLQFMGSQRAGHDLVTELNWICCCFSVLQLCLRVLQILYVSCFTFSSVQSLRCVWLFATPWITARQASLSITNSQSLLKLMPIESVTPSKPLILCGPLLLLPPIPPSIRVFSNESTLHMRWPKYWSFSFSISPSNDHPGRISLRMDWLDLLAVQGTLKSLLQHLFECRGLRTDTDNWACLSLNPSFCQDARITEPGPSCRATSFALLFRSKWLSSKESFLSNKQASMWHFSFPYSAG